MSIRNFARRGLTLVAGACLATAANAEEFVFEATVGDLVDTILPPDAPILSLPQFDASLGELESIRVDIEATLRSVLEVTNNSPQTADIQIRNEVPLVLLASPLRAFDFSATLMNQADFPQVAFGETRNSGILDMTVTDCVDTAGDPACSPGDLAALSLNFVGAGMVDFSFGVASGQCFAAGPGNVIEDCRARVQIKVRVTYTTVEDNDCPKVNRRRCASLLLFPEFDNRYGIRTVATVTNKSTEDDVCAHFIYVGRKGRYGEDLNCEEFDRTECLTPNDTISVMTNKHNPQMDQGYFYVYAVDEDTREAISANDLIGHMLVVDGLETFEYAVNPVDYRAIPERGDVTDLDMDGIRDLNGEEYEKTACELLIPRFIGQGERLNSKMIFIGLSGGAQFTTTADLLIYNDDEEAFSANHTFRCWDKVGLTEITNAFKNDFLKSTNDDSDEKLGPYEYGWIRVKGGHASAGAKDIPDPAIYAVLIEIISTYAAADLPFELCHNKSGHLLPRGVTGDNEE